MTKSKIDFPTLIAISAFSFILSTAIHEQLGHALVCVAQGGQLKGMGAFYVDCNSASLSSVGNRLVTLAGPLVSLITGLIGFSFFDRTAKNNAILKYFLWLFSTTNLMTATGYLLFSGVAGIGDLGMDSSGLFYQVQPEWLYRILLTLSGLASYYWVIRVSLRKMEGILGGQGNERVQHAQKLSLTSYFTGGVIAILIGLLNPYGLIIVLISSFASSMGGTSGLAWMMQIMDRTKVSNEELLTIERSRGWITASIIFVAVYALVFGPTVYLK